MGPLILMMEADLQYVYWPYVNLYNTFYLEE